MGRPDSPLRARNPFGLRAHAFGGWEMRRCWRQRSFVNRVSDGEEPLISGTYNSAERALPMRSTPAQPARQGHSGWVPRSRRERGKGREGDSEIDQIQWSRSSTWRATTPVEVRQPLWRVGRTPTASGSTTTAGEALRAFQGGSPR